MAASEAARRLRGMEQRHTTCYFDTFIGVAPDSTAVAATEPPSGDAPSVAARSYRMIADAPYAHTSDDVIFTVWADRREIPGPEREAAREEFFSKGRACLRASDLGRRYGWGIHADQEGRVALYPLGSDEYDSLSSGVDPRDGRAVAVKQAMRSRRA